MVESECHVGLEMWAVGWRWVGAGGDANKRRKGGHQKYVFLHVSELTDFPSHRKSALLFYVVLALQRFS